MTVPTRGGQRRDGGGGGLSKKRPLCYGFPIRATGRATTEISLSPRAVQPLGPDQAFRELATAQIAQTGKTLDRVAEDEVRSEKGQKRIFINVTTVSPALGRVGHPKESSWDQRKHPSITRLCQNGQNGKTAA